MIRALRQSLCLILLALGPALISGFVQLEWRGHREELLPGEVRPGTAQMWGEQVLWIDARERKAYQAAHIPGAVLLNEDEWEDAIPAFLQAWDPNKTIIVYGENAKNTASQAIAERLRSEVQLESVYVLKGGWEAWRKK